MLTHQITFESFIILRDILFQTPEHYAEKGVRVICICPWFVDTPLASGDMLTASTFPAIMKKLYKNNKHTLIK